MARVEVAATRVGAEEPEERGTSRTAWQRLLSNSLFRHNVLLFGANMASSALTFLFHPIVGHILGSAAYGTVVSFGAFTVVLGLPTAVIPSLFNKFTADLVAHGRIDQVNYLLRRLTRYGLVVGVLAAAIFAAFSPVLMRVFNVSLFYVLVTSLGFLFAFAAPMNWGAIQGRQQFGWFASLNFLSAFLRVSLTTLVLLLGFGLNGTIVAGFIGACIIYALSFLPLRDVFRGAVARLPSFRPLFSYSLGATLALGGGQLLVNLDTALAAPFLHPRDAGYYDALATIGRIVLFVGGSLYWAMFPKVAEAQQQGRPHTGILGWTLGGVLTLSASVVALFALFPNQIVTIIFHEPPAIAQQLVWYGIAMMCLAASNILIGYYLALGRMAFVPILLACCGLQAVLLVAMHGSVARMVMDMVVTMAVLLCGMVILYVVQVARTGGGSGLSTEPSQAVVL